MNFWKFASFANFWFAIFIPSRCKVMYYLKNLNLTILAWLGAVGLNWKRDDRSMALEVATATATSQILKHLSSKLWGSLCRHINCWTVVDRISRCNNKTLRNVIANDFGVRSKGKWKKHQDSSAERQCSASWNLKIVGGKGTSILVNFAN